MQITSFKTHKITTEDTLLAILDRYVTVFKEKSILVIASKIVAITQGRVTRVTKEEKEELIKQEADYYLSPEKNAFPLFITRKENHLNYSAGIDESNVQGGVVLWPKDVQSEANRIRAYLVRRFAVRCAGVIITDMTVIPLQRGNFAGPIAYSGFLPLKDLTNSLDIFGRPFHYTMQGMLQGLAAGAGVVMGEGAEQTPLGIIEDLPFVEFQERDPTKEELASLTVTPEKDLYGSLIKAVTWRKGGK